MRPSAQSGAATGTGQYRIGRDLLAAGRAVKPVVAGATLLLGETLLFFALGASTIHFALAQVIGKEEPASRAVLRTRPGDIRFTSRQGTLEDRFTLRTPVFTLEFRLAGWAGLLRHDALLKR